jgi:hypothetical protein
METAVTGVAGGKKEKTVTMMLYATAYTLTGIPHLPIFHGPNSMGSPDSLFRIIRLIVIIYVEKKPAATRDMMALNATVEPMLINPSKQLIRAVRPIE